MARALVLAAAVVSVLGVLLSRILPPRLGDPEAQAFSLHRARVIIGSALCEGASLFCVVAYIVSHDIQALYVAALPFAGLLFQFPSMEQVEREAAKHQR